jgi:hypothetical protein
MPSKALFGLRGRGRNPSISRENMFLAANHSAADPLPDEIRRMCEQIRREWTVGEGRRRAAWADAEPWTVPEVSALLLAEVDDRNGKEPE